MTTVPQCETGSCPARQAEAPESPDVRRARNVMALLFGEARSRRFNVRYWNRFEEGPIGNVPPPFTLLVRRPDSLRRMLLPPTELAIAEAFVRGDVDVEGDLEQASLLGESIADRVRSPRVLVRLAAALLQLPVAHSGADGTTRHPSARRSRRHSRMRDAAAIRFHYDLGNTFYGLWLDRNRVYSCAYFPSGDEDLEAAQIAKLDHVCRKLRLRPGERLLDIGCGWGGLLHHAARHYGVEAVGVTLSPAQASYARARIAADGLAARCAVELCDYRDLSADVVFDKVVSVGMFEHVGAAQLPEYFSAAWRLTAPGGLFLNHGIVTLGQARSSRLLEPFLRTVLRQGEFIERYVFPDGELVPLGEAIRCAEAVGFETRDVESLREHYAATLRDWGRRLEAHRDEAVTTVGEQTYRTWRLYMAASARNFTIGRIGVDQMLFSKPDVAGRCALPPTRADLYA